MSCFSACGAGDESPPSKDAGSPDGGAPVGDAGEDAADGTSGDAGVEPTTISAKTLAVGGRFACALQDDGAIVCWGADDWKAEVAPPQGEAFVKIYAGLNQICGLRADESAICWGTCGEGRCDVPANGLYKILAAGGYHTPAAYE